MWCRLTLRSSKICAHHSEWSGKRAMLIARGKLSISSNLTYTEPSASDTLVGSEFLNTLGSVEVVDGHAAKLGRKPGGAAVAVAASRMAIRPML